MTTLEAARQHSAAVNAQTSATQAQAVEAMRAEIGPQHYRAAKEQLPIIDRALGENYRPFLAVVTTIKFGVSAPAQVRQWCAEMERLFTVLESIR